MTFYVEMVFLGRLNRAALAQSVAEAAVRHPLLLARMELGRKGWQWVLPANCSIPIDYQDAGTIYAPPRGPTFDLTRESGLRVWVREDEERTSVTFQLHHACCDGEGSRHFGFDLLTAYSRLTSDEPRPDWTRVEYQRLRERAIFQPATADNKPSTTTFWQKLRDGYHFHVLGPCPLASSGSRTRFKASPPRPLMIKHLFSREESVKSNGSRRKRAER